MGRDDHQDLQIQALRKATTGLETLIDSPPEGVVVFDGETGAPVSINPEIRSTAGKTGAFERRQTCYGIEADLQAVAPF